MKCCTKCGINKIASSEFFRIQKRNKEGLQFECRECNKLYAKIYYKNNKEKVLKRTKENNKKYYINNKGIELEKNKKWRQENKEKLIEYDKERYDFLKRRFNLYKSQAKRRNLVFELTLEEFSSFANMSCSYCGDPSFHIGLDRINNTIGYVNGNITSCCKICNYMKRCMSIDDFYKKCEQIINYKNRIIS